MRRFKVAALFAACTLLILVVVAAAADNPGRQTALPFDESAVSSAVTSGTHAASQALGSPGDLVNFGQSILRAGNYLKGMQADVTEDNAGNGTGAGESPNDPDDAGWDWSVVSPPAPYFHTTAASPTNIYGATALGLYYAYLETNTASYFTAMQDAANWIRDHQLRTASDLQFLMLFDDLPAVTGTVYQDTAKARYDYRISLYGSATAFAQYIRDARGVTQGYPNGIIGWDIGAYAVVAQMLYDRYGTPYDSDADAMAEVLWQDSYNDNPGLFDVVDDAGWDPTYANKNYWWYTLGIAGLMDAFHASGSHTAELPDLAARMVASQYTHGAISGSYGANDYDEDWQSTGYVIRALYRYDATTYATVIAHGAYWAAVTQDETSGAWKYSDNSHYPEVCAEATYAVVLGSSPTVVWVDDDWASQDDVDVYNAAHGTSLLWGYDAFGNIQDGVNGVSASTVNILPGTYVLTSTVNLNKPNLLVDGSGAGQTIVQVAQAVGYAFNISAAGVTLQDIELQKTDVAGVHNLIYIGASNVSILNNLIYGPDPGTLWSVNGIVSRAMITTGGLSGLLIDGNTIRHLRQPAYFSGPTTGVVSNNAVSGTRGWVNEGANLTFTGNSWPLPPNQGAEIALLAYAVDPSWYPDLIGLSNANNNAYIDAQFTGGDKGRAISYVDAAAAAGGLGSVLAPFQTIAAGVGGVLKTGTVQVAAGTYAEHNIAVGKAMSILGAGSTSTVIDATGFAANTSPVVAVSVASGNVLFDGFKIMTGAMNGITVSAPSAASVVTITHNELIGNGVNTDPAPGSNFGLIAGYGMLGKVIFDYNTVHDFYDNSLLFEKQAGETQIMHNSFFDTYQIFYMTYGGVHVNSLQKVSANTFDVSGVAGGGNSGVYFNSATHYAPPVPNPNAIGKYTNVEISSNVFNNVGDNDRALGLGNDNNNNGTDGEITAPRILNNTINGTGSVTNCRGMQLIGYITNASIEGNIINGVKEGIRLWNGAYSTGYYPVAVSLTDNTVLGCATGLLNMGATLTAEENVFGNTTNCSDSKPGNTYDANCYSDYNGIPPYAIGGGGGNVDNNPSSDCGLAMSPDNIYYDCSGTFTITVDIGSAVTAMDAANIHFEYPAELGVTAVTAASSNYFLAYTQSNHAVGTRDTLKVNLGVLTGVQDGPATLFTFTMSGTVSVCNADQIMMVYADLRDSTNTQIVAPLAVPVTFRSDCNDPDIVVNSPASGGFFNLPPVLSLTATDDCDLDVVYYQIDGCAPGGWTAIASGLSGTTYNAMWTLPGFVGLADGEHCIRLKVVDDNARANADSCSYTWCFTKDVAPPPPPTNLAAAPGHNKVHLTWTNASTDFDHTIVMRTDWYTGGHGYPEYDDDNAEGPYPVSPATGDQVYNGTAATHVDVTDLSNATRDVYHYAAFTVDKAGNFSVASNGTRATSYWLGDVKSPFDGSVYFLDLVVFSSTYGLQHGDVGYNNEADIGPTFTGSPKSIPMTDSRVEFEDLVIFAINFDAVSPLLKDRPILVQHSAQTETSLRLVQRLTDDGIAVDLYLENPTGAAKALLADIEFDPSLLEYATTAQSDNLANSPRPIFFKALTSPKRVSISAAALGTGSTFDGSGLIATVVFKPLGSDKPTVRLTRADVRDSENKHLIDRLGPTIAQDNGLVADIPESYVVEQNRPNPFNPETVIYYALPAGTQVSVRVYNVVGQLVRTLVDEYQSAGAHQVTWNGTNDSGERVASGIYFYRFETADYQKTIKMTLLK